MDPARFQLDDASKEVFLHFEHKKYWSIQMNRKPPLFSNKIEITFETVVKCGKLDEDGHEEQSSVQAHNKDHESFCKFLPEFPYF